MKIFTDSLHKIAYSTDASVYREIPYGVAYPESETDIKELLVMAREKGVDLIPRAGGTSIAGQVVGSGIVVDISKHLNRIIEINPEERWARVEPGVVRDELNLRLKPYGLFFSPETSTSNRCCIGGMFGNNSCGTHSLVYGSTRHHVVEARGVLADGSTEIFKEYKISELEERFGLQFWNNEQQNTLIERIYTQLIRFALNAETSRLIAESYPDKQLRRRSCGYAIDEVIDNLTADTHLPFSQRTINLCKLLAGSEGTLAFITEIKVSLDHLPPKHLIVVCGHCDTLEKSFEANLVALSHRPTAIELMDSDILELSKANTEARRNQFFVVGKPAALLLTELRADTREELDAKASRMEKDLIGSGLVYKCTRVYDKDVARVWALRKAGLGVLGGMKGDARPHGVIEDTAVAPSVLPQYLKEFRLMLERLGTKCVFYGHISTGELHLRPILNLKKREDRQLFRTIACETTMLVKKHRGSISGEHGDGRLRGEFIKLLYGDKAYELMRQVKFCWDEENLLNRHKIVDTLPMDSCLRYDEDQQYEVEKILKSDATYFNWKAAFDECDAPGATGARSQVHALMCSIEQCNGAGDCRKSNAIGGTLCPAYKVSGDELQSTRARANILRELLTRGLPAQSTLSDQSDKSDKSDKSDQSSHSLIEQALYSCLACKGCKGECPSNVDMTRIRAQVLQMLYDRHGTPFRSWMVARMAMVERLGHLVYPLYNYFATARWSSTIIKRIVSFSPQRAIPPLSSRSMRRLVKADGTDKQATRKVYLFADEFTDLQEAELGRTFARLLTALGYQVIIPDHVESGRAAISKGCLHLASSFARRNVERLRHFVTDDTPLVGIEPSCILTFRDEYPDLVPPELRDDAVRLGHNCLLYDEFIMREVARGNIRAEQFSTLPVEVWLHGHCHQKALVGIEKTAAMLRLLKGITLHIIPSGCCGMAGSFGYEKEHYATSIAIGEMVLFPTLRRALPQGDATDTVTPTLVAAPGTSCRQQILDGTGIHALHPVEIMYRWLAR